MPSRSPHVRDRRLIDLFQGFHNREIPALNELRFRSAFVPGDGSLIPRAIFVGEAPGASEDKAGAPFVGRSGRLLDLLLEAARLDRERVWITNVVKYRPPKNRTPTDEEIAASLPLLRREVALVAGDARIPLVGLGRVASSALARRPISVGRTHGSWVQLRAGWTMFVSYHPSAGLRNQNVADSMLLDFFRLGRDLA